MHSSLGKTDHSFIGRNSESSAVEPRFSSLLYDPEWVDMQSFIEFQDGEELGGRSDLEEIEDLSEQLPNGGDLYLEKAIGVSETSRVFSVMNNKRLVIKYQAFCLHYDIGHPLVREFWFLNRIEDLGISPKAHFVSGASPLPAFVSEKTDFAMTSAQRNYCRGSQVRFLVMDRRGPSVHDLMMQRKTGHRTDHRIHPRRAVWIALKTMQAVEKLHVVGGVVHGDIHYGNIVLEGTEGVGLIDFGRAFSVNTIGAPPDKIRAGEWNHEMFSPWEIKGFRPGPRDDVFRVVLMLSFMLCGKSAEKRFRPMKLQQPGAAWWAKLNEGMFRFCDPLAEYSFTDTLTNELVVDAVDPILLKERVYQLLDQVADFARAVPTLDGLPLYRPIIEDLAEIYSLL